jgi:homocysteine S-methyltransferase
LEAGADLLAFETIPSIKEGLALCKLLDEYPNTKAWLSFSCKV